MDTKTYKVVRKFFNDELEDELVEEGMTLKEAQAHCTSKESSSRTATSKEGVKRTREHGAWFDAYYPEEEE